MFGEKVGWILGTFYFAEFEHLAADPFLNPQSIGADMSLRSQADSLGDSDRSGAVRVHTQWKIDAEVLEELLDTNAYTLLVIDN